MGHVFFLMTHAFACMLGFFLLIFTVPMHLVYSAIRDPQVMKDRERKTKRQKVEGKKKENVKTFNRFQYWY